MLASEQQWKSNVSHTVLLCYDCIWTVQKEIMGYCCCSRAAFVSPLLTKPLEKKNKQAVEYTCLSKTFKTLCFLVVRWEMLSLIFSFSLLLALCEICSTVAGTLWRLLYSNCSGGFLGVCIWGEKGFNIGVIFLFVVIWYPSRWRAENHWERCCQVWLPTAF